MQPAISNRCTTESHVENVTTEPSPKTTITLRRWLDDALAWLDRYWDDPELRSGFWRSGW